MTIAPSRPPLRYHGGKWRLAPWIIEHLPRHVCYVEPFGGAMGVLLRKPRSEVEVYNDMDGDVVRFFRVLRDQPEDLIRVLLLTPYSREEFLASYEATDDDLEAARRVYVRAWQGMGSSLRPGRTGWRFDRTNKRGSSIAHQWCTHDVALRQVAQRLLGVMIECGPALKVIDRFDNDKAVFYVDPPYVTSARCGRGADYRHELTDDDHRELAERLHAVRGAVLVSGYLSDLYDEIYHGWRRLERTSRTFNAQARTEVLWISPKADRCAAQGCLFE